jgi:hypothetical protein
VGDREAQGRDFVEVEKGLAMKPRKSNGGQRVAEQKPYDRRGAFVKALAEFLAGNQAAKSISLQVECESKLPRPVNWAQEWAKLRGTTPLFGYPSVDEAEKEIRRFLFGE